MIVFYLLLSLILLIILLLFSSITIDINKIEIKSIEELKKVYLVLHVKEYQKIFSYIDLEIKVKIVICSIFPILVIRINSEKAKKIINHLLVKDLKNKQKNPVKYELKRQKQIKQLKKISACIKIKDANFNLNIGLTNAGVTAIATGVLNAIISVLMLEYFSNILKKQTTKDSDKQLSNIIKNLNYVVNPIYSDDFAFSLNSNLKLKISIHSLF